MKDQVYWLLERPSKAVPSPTYFSGFTSSGLSVTLDYDRALKFETKAEAVRFANYNNLHDWDVREHMWCNNE